MIEILGRLARQVCAFGLWPLLLAAAAPLAHATDADSVPHPAAATADALYQQALAALLGAQPLEAERLLLQLMREHPTYAAAWLELALLYCAAGQQARADALWDELLARFAPPEPIVALVARLRAPGCAAPAEPPAAAAGAQVSARIELGRGQSSNANQGVPALDVLLQAPSGPVQLRLHPHMAARPDAYTHWLLELNAQPRTAHWQALLHWQKQRFDHEHSAHSQSLALAVQQPWHGERWQGQALAALTWLEVGGASHQWRVLLHARALPPWQPLPGVQWHLEPSLSWQHYPQSPAFDARISSLRSSLSGTLGAGAWRAELGWQHDAALSLRPGGARKGWLLGLHWAQPLAPLAGRPLSLQAHWQQQQWRSSRVYAPGLIETARQQHQQQASLALRWQPHAQTAWLLQWTWLKNNENIALFAHNNQTLHLGWQYQWGLR